MTTTGISLDRLGPMARRAPRIVEVTPNQISILSVAWAALGGALLLWEGWLSLVATAATISQRSAQEAPFLGKPVTTL